MPYSIEHSFVLDDWIIHSTNSAALILYLISVQLHTHFCDHLVTFQYDDGTLTPYVEIGHLEVAIHNNVYKSVQFKAIAGTGYKLPRLCYYGANV
jgi:hypothetical protein